MYNKKSSVDFEIIVFIFFTALSICSSLLGPFAFFESAMNIFDDWSNSLNPDKK